jgi:hypothetical protein
MATFNKYNNFVQDLGRKVHNLNADTLKVALTNAAPNAATHAVLADITEISAANGYVAGGAAMTGTGWAQTSGVGKLAGSAVSWTASGGSIGPFRYAVLYNDTPTSPADPLIGWWDAGSAQTVTAGITFNLTPADTTNILQDS